MNPNIFNEPKHNNIMNPKTNSFSFLFCNWIFLQIANTVILAKQKPSTV